MRGDVRFCGGSVTRQPCRALMKLARAPAGKLSCHALEAIAEIKSADFQTAKMLVDWQAKEKDPVKRQQIIDAMGSHRSVEGVRLIFLR